MNLPHYSVSGPADASAVVLLHAGIADSRMWRDQVSLLSERFLVVAIDQRGFGRSPLLSGPVDRVEDVRAVLDELAIASACVVGCSFGGMVATELALRYPRHVDRLVLVGSALRGWEWSDEVAAVMAAEDEAYEAGDHERIAELMVDLWLADDAARDVADLVRTMQLDALRLPEPDPPPEDSPPLDPPASERLGEIVVPTLVVVGEEDVEDIKAIASLLVAEIPDTRLQTIPDAAHLPPLEQPERFNRVLLEWLIQR